MSQFKKAIVESSINADYFAVLITDTKNDNKTYVKYYEGVEPLEEVPNIDEFLMDDIQQYIDQNKLWLWSY